MTTEDERKFKIFMKYYELFSVLINNKIFDIEFGKCTLNIARGEVQNIVKEQMVFRR